MVDDGFLGGGLVEGLSEGSNSGRQERVGRLVDVVSAAADALSKPRVVGLLLEVMGEPKTAAELSRVLGVSESSVRRYTNLLRKCGLVVFASGIDGRKKFVKLSKLGLNVASKLRDSLVKSVMDECATEVSGNPYQSLRFSSINTRKTFRHEDLVSKACAERIIKQYHNDPIKALRKLGFRPSSEGSNYLVKG